MIKTNNVNLKALFDNGIQYLKYGGQIICTNDGGICRYELYRDDDIEDGLLLCNNEPLEFGEWHDNETYIIGSSAYGKQIYLSKKEYDIAVLIPENLKDWLLSEYNEDTEDQLDYYINENKMFVGDTAYCYSHANEELTKMKIIKIIARSNDISYYDNLDENVLIDGETTYNADTSAEFITDNNCYLVWFTYVTQ